jgi:hypothetical protein
VIRSLDFIMEAVEFVEKLPFPSLPLALLDFLPQ